MNASTSHPYGVPQARDWNALSDDAFRALIRDDFEAHYPVAQRFAPRRLRWSENHDWYLRMSAKGWIAPAWPVAFGGMGLAPSKLLIFFEEQERCGIARFQDHGVQMVGPVLMKFGTEAQRERFLKTADSRTAHAKVHVVVEDAYSRVDDFCGDVSPRLFRAAIIHTDDEAHEAGHGGDDAKNGGTDPVAGDDDCDDRGRHGSATGRDDDADNDHHGADHKS